MIGSRPRPGTRRTTNVAELRKSVARDLEWLLNTRLSIPPAFEQYEEARASVLGYGLQDLSTRVWESGDDRRTLAEEIRVAIQRFEPRLAPYSVDVRVLGRSDKADARLRYQISATLHVEPIHESVLYDTELDTERLTLNVSEAD